MKALYARARARYAPDMQAAAALSALSGLRNARCWMQLAALPIAAWAFRSLALALPGVGEWPAHDAFAILPYVLFAVAAGLAFAFTQSRVAYLALLLLAAMHLVRRFAFTVPDEALGMSTARVAALLAPPFAALLYRLPERGVFTPHGAVRGAVFLATVVLLCGLPWLPGPLRSAARAAPALAPLTALNVAVFAAALPALLAARENESPNLGFLLGLGLVLFGAGLTWQAGAPPTGNAAALFLLAAAASGLTLAAAVLESAWRHANMDELTGLPGRRFLRYRLRCLAGQYAVAMADVDHFKTINDRFGHDVGDQVLKFVAAALRRVPGATAYRYGGEEFALVAPRCLDFDTFLDDLDGLRQAIARKEFFIRGPDRPNRKPDRAATAPVRSAAPPAFRITISFGAARANRRYADPRDALAAADRALYRAKETGRNRVFCIR